MRKCTNRKTGIKFAVKIIDLHGGSSTDDAEAIREEYLNEVAIIKKLALPPGHPNISKYTNTKQNIILLCVLCLISTLHGYIPTISLSVFYVNFI